MVTPPRDAAPATPAPSAVSAGEATAPPGATTSIIDWSRTARRLRTVLATIGVTAVVVWLIVGFLGEGPAPRLLAELLGLGLLLSFAVEIVVVGGVAIRGMLTAGARGDRLASQDVTLLPPQLLGRRARQTGDDG